MNCRDVREFMVLYMEGEVAPSERRMLEAHLRDCKTCAEEMARLSETRQRLSAALRAMAAEASPSPRAWEGIRRRLDRGEGKLLPGRWPFSLKLNPAAAVAILLIFLAGILAITPSVRAQIGQSIIRWVPLKKPEFRFEIRIPSTRTEAPRPMGSGYLPESILAQKGNITLVYLRDDGSLSLFFGNPERLWVCILQSKEPSGGAQSLPAGKQVKVKGEEAVLLDARSEDLANLLPFKISGKRAGRIARLVWDSEGFRFEAFSNLPEEELLKVAETMKPVDVDSVKRVFGGLPWKGRGRILIIY